MKCQVLTPGSQELMYHHRHGRVAGKLPGEKGPGGVGSSEHDVQVGKKANGTWAVPGIMWPARAQQ